MKSGLKSQGFTIVETLIVLAVTSALLISALALFSGSQNRTQFSQSINDINQEIGNVQSNVTNGYYNNTITDKVCKVVGTGAPQFTSGTPSEGSNLGCIYLGRVLQFTDSSNYYVYDVVGRQKTGTPPADVTQMKDALPQIIQPSGAINTNYPTTTESRQLKNGLVLKWIHFTNAAGKTTGLAFMSSLASLQSGGSSQDLQSGATSIDYGPTVFNPAIQDPAGLDNKQDPYILAFDSSSGFGANFDANKNPASGVGLCFESGTTKQYGLITVGGSGRHGATDLKVGQGDCSAVTFP